MPSILGHRRLWAGGVGAVVLSLAGTAAAVAGPARPGNGGGPGGGATGSAMAGCGTDWPSFQHDGAHTGRACGTITPADVAGLRPRWFLPTTGAVTAEPAVVGGTAYVGDGGGIFHAVALADGRQRWGFDAATYDRHAASYGVITSSATYTDQVPGHGPMVIFGGGGSVFALDAGTGALIWHTDLAPADPTGPDEVESSPVVEPGVGGGGAVVVGLDTNESTGGVSGGVVALDAADGQPMWSFEPGTGTAFEGSLPQGGGDGCSDVWSSPAVDPTYPGGGLVVFGTGNCPSGGAYIDAVDLRSGRPRWVFAEPVPDHGGDDDFGSSAVLAHLGDRPVVVEAGKSGWVYVLDESTGAAVDSAEVAQPGQTGDALAGAIGGFIGAMALGQVGGDPVVFGSSAVPAPFTSNGISTGGATADRSLLADPTRASSLHAFDIATGRVLWHEPLQAPAYAPVTVTNGVVFAPSTTSFSLGAFDAATGAPLWAVPLAASPSGGVAVSGSGIVFGTGTYDAPGSQLPPQATGIWMFELG